MDPIRLTGQSLDLALVARVARYHRPVLLDPAARERMAASHAWVMRAARGEITGADGEPLPVYGVNTGYGSLARVRIPREHIQALSLNLIRSHAAGVGDPLPRDVVRATMLLRANALAKGASGCRPELVDTICAMLAADLVPEIPSQGSCGSSGDLAPLAHLGLVMFCGEGEDDPASSGVAWLGQERMTGAEAMRRAGLARRVPGPKEGLAITNGAQVSTALLALASQDAAELVLAAEIAAAMSWEALQGVSRALHPDVQALRPYPGAKACASNLLWLMEGSSLVDSLPGKVQDAYALRCTPQVLGASRDGIAFARRQASIEINAATDNPVILLDSDHPNKAYSAGLFHGEPVGMAADHLKLAVSELANIAERRVYRLTTGTLSSRLPPLLARRDRPGLGLMTPQITAAALVSENKSLLWPATGDSIPTCEDQEDHVAMSTTAARRAAEVVANSTRVIAIELLCAAQALAWRRREDPTVNLGRGTNIAFELIEGLLGGETASDDIERVAVAVRSGELLDAVQAVTGPLEGVDHG